LIKFRTCVACIQDVPGSGPNRKLIPNQVF